MSFIKQYDRLFVATFGLVNLIRGGGGIIELLLTLGGGSAKSMALDGAAALMGISSLFHLCILMASGIGLLARRPFGWKLSILFHTNEVAKLGAAFLIAALSGGSAAAVRMSTEILVQMTWALFSLLVFLMKPIAEICRIDGKRIGVAAIPWVLLGITLATVKLYLIY